MVLLHPDSACQALGEAVICMCWLLQLASLWRDRAVRRKYQELVGKPKQGSWSLRESSYSSVVYVISEENVDHEHVFKPDPEDEPLQLSEQLSFLGQGQGTPVE